MKIKKVITFVVAQFIRVWVTAFAGIAVYVPLSALAFAERGYKAIGGEIIPVNNGGLIYLEWLRDEKTKDTVYDDRTIQWLDTQSIRPDMLDFISDKMSVQQIKNYICRQMSENSMTSRDVIQTWSDYLGMAERLKMNTSDPIVYRAKKLRQRHDELVKEVDDKLSVSKKQK